jgi:hypothetical protein
VTTTPAGPPEPPDFRAIGPSAAEAAKATAAETSAAVDPSTAPANPDVPASAYTEVYRSEVEKNMRANRAKRWWAFGVAGTLGTLYLLVLLWVLWCLMDGRFLAALVGASDSLNWHILVLLGIVLVIFAAIPLSLVMALVEMISEREAEPGMDIRTPSTELGRILYDLLKGISSAMGKP